MSGITIVYNEHGGAVPEEGTCNYIAERKREKKKAMTEEVIVDERVLRAAFSFFFPFALFSAPQSCKEADEGGTRMWRWHDSPVWRQGDKGWK